MLVLNLKTFPQAAGTNLAGKLDAVHNVLQRHPQLISKILVSVNHWQLFWAMQTYPEINFVAQHLDAVEAGPSTGWLPVSLAQELGIDYAIINHSEHRLLPDILQQTLRELQNTRIKIIACCESMAEAKQILQLQPFAVAYESSALIGTGISVTTMPEMVQELVGLCNDTDTLPFIGAGVTTSQDVADAYGLGAEGAILASAFAKADDPESTLEELIKPLAAQSAAIS